MHFLLFYGSLHIIVLQYVLLASATTGLVIQQPSTTPTPGRRHNRHNVLRSLASLKQSVFDNGVDGCYNSDPQTKTKMLDAVISTALLPLQLPPSVLVDATERLLQLANGNGTDSVSLPSATDEGKLVSSFLASVRVTMRHLHEITEKGTQLEVRRSLQAYIEHVVATDEANEAPGDTASQNSNDAKRTSSSAVLSVCGIDAALAIEQSNRSRAIASAVSSTVMRHTHEAGSDNSDINSYSNIVQAIVESLLKVTANDPEAVDLHIVASLCEIFPGAAIDPSMSAKAIQASLRAYEPSVGRIPDAANNRQRIAAALKFACAANPWAALSPSYLVEIAAINDLWHAAERICAAVITAESSSTAPQTDNNNNSDNCERAVETLIDNAIEAKRYRQGDDFATKFFAHGGQSRYLNARWLHACSTITKMVSKRQFPMIERQVQRLDQAAELVHDPKVGEEIRTFALDMLVQEAEIDAANRLAQLWGKKLAYSEQELMEARERRKQRYIQWHDIVPKNVPVPADVVSTPEDLLRRFAQFDGTLVFGFDVEWSADDEGNGKGSTKGGGASLLQIAATQHGAILIDIPALSRSVPGVEALRDTVGDLFHCSKRLVIGFACSQDVHKLRSSPITLSGDGDDDTRSEKGGSVQTQQRLHWLSKGTNSVIDLKKVLSPDRNNLGLSRACERYYSKPLDKSEQCSAWAHRPLTLEQRTYAALDAYVCAALYEKVVIGDETTL